MIVVFDGMELNYMNTLSNKILSHVTGVKNFFRWQKDQEENLHSLVNKEEDLYDKKIFKALNLIDKSKTMSGQKQVEDHDTEGNKALEYSLREIIFMDETELDGRIFCFKETNEDNLGKSVLNLTKVIKTLSCFSGIE